MLKLNLSLIYLLLTGNTLVFSGVLSEGSGDTSSTNEVINEASVNRKFDYKLSFQKPYKILNTFPNFEGLEGSIVTDHYIRLSSSIPGSRGSIWSTVKNPYKDFELEYSFQVTGRGQHGKDGLAFWISEDRAQPGPILGSKDKWNGVGILHDTYDKVSDTVAPYILGINNDGTKEIANTTNVLGEMFGGCFRDFRNTAHPVHVRVSYVANVFRVSVDSLQQGKNFINCFENHEIVLPSEHYFGFSASSAHPADDHDVFKFSVYEVNPEPNQHDMNRPYEKEVIEEEGKFKLSDKLKKKMEDVRNKLNKLAEAAASNDPLLQAELDAEENFGKEGSVNTGLQETQFRILDSLNIIHQKLDQVQRPSTDNKEQGTSHANPNTNQQQGFNHHDGVKLNHKLDVLTKSISSVEAQVHQLSSQIHGVKQSDNDQLIKLQNQVEKLSSMVEKVLTHSEVNKDHVGSKLDSLATYFTYLLYLLGVSGLVTVGNLIYKAKFVRQEKKYL